MVEWCRDGMKYIPSKFTGNDARFTCSICNDHGGNLIVFSLAPLIVIIKNIHDASRT